MTTECQQLQYHPSSLKVKISIDKPDKKGAPPYVDPRQRLVWLLARPLPGIRSITSVAAGGFPILHWAVLLSPRGYEKKRMKSLLETLQRWPRDLQHFHMGTISTEQENILIESANGAGKPIGRWVVIDQKVILEATWVLRIQACPISSVRRPEDKHETHLIASD